MEEEISAPKGSVLEQLTQQDLSLQGVEELTARIALLKEEITRAEAMLAKSSRNDAEALSNKFSRGLADKAVKFFVKARHATASPTSVCDPLVQAGWVVGSISSVSVVPSSP